MRPFRFFFGLSIAVILFFFVAKVLIYAFIIALVFSIIFAIARRIRDFITYDRNGDYYIPAYKQQYLSGPGMDRQREYELEPLFYDDQPGPRNVNNNIQFVDIS